MNNNLDKSIELILENGEKVNWSGKPSLIPFIIGRLFGSLPFILLGFAIFKFGSSNALFAGELFMAIGFLVFLGGFVSAIVTSYAITDRRVILKSGLIGADIESVYYNKLKDISVDVGLIGKLSNTGSVMLNTGDRETYTDKDGQTSTTLVTKNLLCIKNPYDIYKQLQTILNDRKNAQYSGRKDFEDNKEGYKEFVQQTEEFKKEI